MDANSIENLIQTGLAGELSENDQRVMAAELIYYRDAALRLERSIHDMVKDVEKACGI